MKRRSSTAGRRRRALALAVAAASVWTSPVWAQRYRVLVSEEASTRVSVVEFRPCVPAETSDCGAWLDHEYDGARNSTAERPARRLSHVESSRFGASIDIRAGQVVVTPVSAGKGKPVTVSGTHGTPLALELSGDGAYAFGIFEGVAGQSPELEMIDLNTNSVWAVFRLKARPAAIAMSP